MVLADIIKALHVLFILFMLAAPFVGSMEVVSLHFVLTPFLYLHWLTNDSTCALTMLEKAVRGVQDDRSFFHSLLSPIYEFHKDGVNGVVWAGTGLLWLVSFYRMERDGYKTIKAMAGRSPLALFLKT
jgi:hypothetical protein